MIIEQFRLYQAVIPLRQPKTIALGTAHAAHIALVALASDGDEGFGSASPAMLSMGIGMEQLINDLQQLRSLLVQREIADPKELHALMQQIPELSLPARAACDIAFHDLLSKRQGRSVTAYLGSCKSHIITSMTLGILNMADTVEAAKQFLSQGFRAIKIKVGLDAALDYQRVAAVRAVAGEDVLLWVDANQGYSYTEAATFCQRIAHLAVRFVEQPLPKHDFDGLRRLADESPVPIMLDESVRTAADLAPFAKCRCPSFINIKLMKTGGILPAVELAQTIQSMGLHAMVGCMFESALSIHAGLALALSQPAVVYADLDAHFDLTEDICQPPLFRDGYLAPLPGNGLGIRLEHEELLKQVE